MLYLKTIDLPLVEKQNLEKAMRKVALKRISSLDLTSAVMDIGTDKLFLGFENINDIKFTRLRTSFEKFPKIIVSIPKSELENKYKFRYSVLSTVIFIAFALLLLLIVVAVFMQNSGYERILVACVPVGIYVLLTMLEMKIVRGRIKKALKLNLELSSR